MSKTYYIFRHGETFATKHIQDYGDLIETAEILDEGKPTIERMAEFLETVPTDYNVSSEFHRCRQTVGIVSEITGKQFVFDSRLNEFYKETFDEMKNRLKNFIDEMNASDYQTVLVCTHGALIAGLVSFLIRHDYNRDDMEKYPPPGILIKIDGDQLEQWNFSDY
jgi:broad specificity phosphatase PhoE